MSRALHLIRKVFMASNRDKFDNIYKWNTKDLYESDEDALKELNVLFNNIDDLKKYENHIMDSAESLLELLELDTEISKKLERIFIYGHINNDADTTNVSYQELFGKVQNVYTKYLEISVYIVPEILKSNYELVDKYINELEDLKVYERSLKHIFRNKEHILSTEVEGVLSSYAKIFDSADEIMGALTDSDFKYGKINVNGNDLELTESNYSLFIRHNDRQVRKNAFTMLHEKYQEFKNTLSKTLKCEVEKNVINAKLRGFKDSLNASLFSNEIDELVYYSLIDGVHNNLKILYRYWELKRQLLKLEELHIYDTYADIDELDSKKYSFEDAKELVLKAVKPLGDTYVSDIAKSFDENWIDSCNNAGKRGGAYCTACYSVHPYVLMSYEGTINDISTLAHELGHAMHYYYACKNQSYVDYGYSIFVAEVASQVNEILLSRYMLDNAKDKNEKIKIIDDLLQKYKSTIFRQTMFAEFELFIHKFTEEGNVLTYQNMCDKYYELNKLYYGDNVVVDDLVQYEWERIPHFYMNFYVYQYATGFAAAVKIANEIYNGNIDIRDKYLEFLKLGCTKNPIDSLKVAGVDMTDSKVLDDAIIFMNELINEYEELLGSDVNE